MKKPRGVTHLIHVGYVTKRSFLSELLYAGCRKFVHMDFTQFLDEHWSENVK
jgi:hypothetical protein